MEELLNQHWTDWQHQGSEHSIDALTPHKNAILDKVNIKTGITVVVDCGNGAGCVLTPDLLAEAGAKPFVSIAILRAILPALQNR